MLNKDDIKLHEEVRTLVDFCGVPKGTIGKIVEIRNREVGDYGYEGDKKGVVFIVLEWKEIGTQLGGVFRHLRDGFIEDEFKYLEKAVKEHEKS